MGIAFRFACFSSQVSLSAWNSLAATVSVNGDGQFPSSPPHPPPLNKRPPPDQDRTPRWLLFPPGPWAETTHCVLLFRGCLQFLTNSFESAYLAIKRAIYTVLLSTIRTVFSSARCNMHSIIISCFSKFKRNASTILSIHVYACSLRGCSLYFKTIKINVKLWLLLIITHFGATYWKFQGLGMV